MEKINSEGIFIVKKGKPEVAFEKRAFQISAPKGKEVLIETEAFGLNYADVMARQGLYREAPAFPCIVGYEVVGKVIQVGAEVTEDLLGKRVLAFCRFGGYAKHVTTFEHAVIVIDAIAADQALALCTQAVTAYYMTNMCMPLRKGERVLIHAASGGVGTMLIQLAKQKGAVVYAKVGGPEKMKTAKELGADFVIDYKKEEYSLQLEKLLDGKKLNVTYNAVGGETFKKDMKLLDFGGTLYLFGGAGLSSGKWGILSALNFIRKMGRPLPIALMMMSKSIVGVNMLKIADFQPTLIAACLKEVLELYKQNKLQPSSGGIYPIYQLNEAHELLEKGKTTGKLTIKW